MGYEPQIGDIVLEDSNKTGAKIVKYFMRSKTLWIDLWRILTNKLEKVQYYHVAMLLSNGFNGFSNTATIAEQQWKVQLDDWNPNSRQIIFRKKDLKVEQQVSLKVIALNDMKKKWDVLNAIGKFLTWLTGIPLFARYVEFPGAEICVNRVASWYWKKDIDKFGVKNHSELTTHLLYKYLINNPNYEVVYRRD